MLHISHPMTTLSEPCLSYMSLYPINTSTCKQVHALVSMTSMFMCRHVHLCTLSSSVFIIQACKRVRGRAQFLSMNHYIGARRFLYHFLGIIIGLVSKVNRVFTGKSCVYFIEEAFGVAGVSIFNQGVSATSLLHPK